MANLNLLVLLLCLLFFVVRTQQQNSFCIPPVWSTSADYEEVFNSNGQWSHTSALVNLSYDVSRQALRGDFVIPSLNLFFSILNLYNEGLEYIWSDGACDVAKIDPPTDLTNCYDYVANNLVFLGGSLGVLSYQLDTPDASAIVAVTKGSYNLITERVRVSTDNVYLFYLYNYFNFETSPHFDGSTFTPPSYCQSRPQWLSTIHKMKRVHLPLNVKSRLIK